MVSGTLNRKRRPRNDPVADAPVAILALTRTGVQLALRLQAQLPESVCYVPRRHQFALALGAQGFERLEQAFREAWSRYRALVCIMATGIVVRHIAPHLQHKTLDPAVVVVDERGQYVISLLSGHLGGANELAGEISRFTGGQAVITTASDVQNKPALDLIARAAELEIENYSLLSRTTRAILEEEPIWIYDPERRIYPWLRELSDVNWVLSGDALEGVERAAQVGIWVSERQAPEFLVAACLQLRPRNLVVGIGCNRGAAAGEILHLLRRVFERGRLSLLSIRNLASIDLKADEPGLLEAAQRVGRPVNFYSRAAVQAVTVPNPSAMVAKHIGVQSVCEATALVSAADRAHGEILIPKQKTPNVTLAVARVIWPS
jgi:cobalt-precorrin 5A hydrolase